MSKKSTSISDAELHAYVDQQLDAKKSAYIETYLATNPEIAEQVRLYRQQNELLHAAFDETLNEQVPHYLLRTRVASRNPWRFAMVAATLTLGIGLGWFGRGELYSVVPESNYSVVSQAAVAHAVYSQEVVHPVEVSADQQEHLVKWLSKRLSTKLRTPHLQSMGFDLEGGRLLPAERGPAAQLMYRDAQGQRLTLYIKTELQHNENTAFRFAQENNISVFYWIDQNIAYALSAQTSREKLLAIAEIVYSQLNQ